VPLKLARQKRDDARKLLSDGVDPAADRKRESAQQRSKKKIPLNPWLGSTLPSAPTAGHQIMPIMFGGGWS
jgi:hypothetical protein